MSELADRVRAVVAAAQAVIRESETRAEFRREHHRGLSGAHKEALQEFEGTLRGLADRLAVLVAPDVDVAALREEYERLVAKLGQLED